MVHRLFFAVIYELKGDPSELDKTVHTQDSKMYHMRLKVMPPKEVLDTCEPAPKSASTGSEISAKPSSDVRDDEEEQDQEDRMSFCSILSDDDAGPAGNSPRPSRDQTCPSLREVGGEGPPEAGDDIAQALELVEKALVVCISDKAQPEEQAELTTISTYLQDATKRMRGRDQVIEELRQQCERNGEEARRLRAQLGESRIERALSEENAQIQLQELQDQMKRLRHIPSSPQEDGKGKGRRGQRGRGSGSASQSLPSSPDQRPQLPPQDSDLLYVQKIVELEETNMGLERQLKLIQESQQTLEEDNKEKNDLISDMLKRVKPAEPTTGGYGGGGRKRFLGGLLSRKDRPKASKRTDADWEELERVAEEAMLDNMRLRNDLQLLAKELRKALALPGNEEADASDATEMCPEAGALDS